MTNKVLKGGIFVGSVHDSLSCGKFKVVDIKSSKNVVVEFLETGFKVNVQAVQIRLGTIKDKMSATYYGVGITGNKYPVSDGNGELTKAYLTWSNMIRRCFSDSYDKRYQTYKDCTCSENFKRYEYFYEWCNKQVGFEKLKTDELSEQLNDEVETYSLLKNKDVDELAYLKQLLNKTLQDNHKLKKAVDKYRSTNNGREFESFELF